MNIIVAEDDEGCAKLLRETLELIPDTQLTFCTTGAEAWWHISDPVKKYDLCICDINMPQVDGLSLLERLRGYAPTTNLAVIMCTGLTSRQNIARAGTLRVTQYILKPYSPSAMLEKVTAIGEALLQARGEVRIA